VTFPKKLLNDYETLALDLHPHWWYFAGPLISFVVAFAFGILVLSTLKDTTQHVFGGLAVIVIGGSVLWFIGRYLRWRTTNFVITSDRLIFRQGVIAKSGIEIPLERVNNVNFTQSIFERMIGAGDLLIESGGEDGRQRFTDIRNPEKVQNLIHSQMEVNEQRRGANHRGDAASTGPVIDVVAQLEKLEGLVSRGALTREEFDAQKHKLRGTSGTSWSPPPPPPPPPPSAGR
jgi:uncharacterized membrane protein YdbT with pleckstrin-like domain